MLRGRKLEQSMVSTGVLICFAGNTLYGDDDNNSLSINTGAGLQESIYSHAGDFDAKHRQTCLNWPT